MLTIPEIATSLGIESDQLTMFGDWAAKIGLGALERPPVAANSRLVLVSAITPTRFGEGKTTTTIGLGDALRALGHSTCIALREPSLGPCFGIKGGGTGGGLAQVVPSERINLHFTGDFHAISSAHNLIAAVLDNHAHFAGEHDIDVRRIEWSRVVDMNDRSLRNVVVGLGGPGNGMPRQGVFEITAASELMAILCLANGIDDLRARIDRTTVALSRDLHPVTAGDLNVTGAVMALLRDAVQPNLARTLEGTPALIHGGPFANIAHGCNSVLATKMALHHADWVVTEAGFGFDLGAEKFYDIKCRSAGLDTAAVVLVASARALKMHGGVPFCELESDNPAGVEAGLDNLAKHIESIHLFTEIPIVAINRFPADSEQELEVIVEFCLRKQVPVAITDHFQRGSQGALELARLVVEHAEHHSDPFHPLYDLELPVPDKIKAIATKMYGATSVAFTKRAERQIEQIDRRGLSDLPICVAKTPSSLSDDPTLHGRPEDFEITVREVHAHTGAGFLVVMTGDVLRMPGLPRTPRAGMIDLRDGEIVGMR